VDMPPGSLDQMLGGNACRLLRLDDYPSVGSESLGG